MKMEEEAEQQPSTKNAGEKARAKQKQEKKKRRRPPSGPKQIHLWMPSFCSPAIAHLKQEMGFRSSGATIHWLIRQVRPELVPHIEPPKNPTSTRPNPKTKSLPKTESVDDVSVQNHGCMPDMSDDNPDSDIPVVAAGDPPAARSPVRATVVQASTVFYDTPAMVASPAAGSPVRATVVQASTVFFDTPATLDKAERLIAGAAAYGSQLVVFPEAFVGGYPRCVRFHGAPITDLSTDEDENLHKYYASAIDLPGPEVDRLAKIAGKYKVYLVMGVVERAGLYLYSTVLFFDYLGQHLGQDRKQTLMAPETAVWYSGEKSSMQIYDTSIGKIGALICWDNKLPLLRTKLYEKGVEIYCAPTADAGEIWKASMTHIALEGGCFVLSANQFCRRRDYPLPAGDLYGERSLDAITCAGGSVIISPCGTILAGPNYQGECLISADLDVGVISEAKSQFGGAASNFDGNHVGQTANVSDSSLIEIEVKMGRTPSPVELSE